MIEHDTYWSPAADLKDRAEALVSQLGLCVEYHERLPADRQSPVGDASFYPPTFYIESGAHPWNLVHEIAHWLWADSVQRTQPNYGLDNGPWPDIEDNEYHACRWTLGLLREFGADDMLLEHVNDTIDVWGPESDTSLSEAAQNWRDEVVVEIRDVEARCAKAPESD